MIISLSAKVLCAEEVCGYLTCVIVNPITLKITHVVVREKRSPHVERLVPEDFILESTPESIHLRCSARDLKAFDEFLGVRFIRAHLPVNFPLGTSTDSWPYGVTNQATIVSKEERIPPGELGIHRGAIVEASDGPIGRVDEFLVDPSDGKITHLALREGHLWEQKEVTIPVADIENMNYGTIHIKLNKRAIAGLPSGPVHRMWKPRLAARPTWPEKH